MNTRLLTLFLCAFAFFEAYPASGATPIVHQVSLAPNQTWCSDDMINGLATQINALRASKGLTALTVSPLGMKDAEIRASQVGTYLETNGPSTPGFNPHLGYDTTAAGLGYAIAGENLAWITTDYNNVVYNIWQDSLHLAAMLSTSANVMGVSCIADGGTPVWTYEPGICTGTSCGTAPTTTPATTPSTPTLDSEDWAFLTLINNYRAQNGLGPLQADVALTNSSYWMSNDMATRNYVGHTDSLGRSAGARLAAFGYSYYPWGENIAAGYASAQSVFDGWRTACDPDGSGNCTYAHQKNMLGAGFTAIGIARVYNASSSYGWYWTTDFGGVVEQSIQPGGVTPLPAIASFTATPSSISAGQATVLAWSVTGATSLAIDNGVGAVSGSQISVKPAATTTYTLTATNSGGSSVARVTVNVTAVVPGDTQPPSAPGLTSAAARSSAEVDLAWSAATDNVGVTGYQVLRNGVALATLGGAVLTYADFAVTPGSVYSYAVRAFDAAGNVSAPGAAIQVAVPVSAPAPDTSCPAPATGAFIACYYSNTTVTGPPALVRTDPQINFDWGFNPPDRSVGRGSFSARWKGNFTFSQGTYTFTAVTSDGMRVYIDGALVLDRWFDQGPTTYTVQQTLAAGTHLIVAEYYESSGTSTVHLTWQGGAPAVQPPSILAFSANPSAVAAGQTSTLTWSVNNASSITIDNGAGDVSGATSKTVAPVQTTTYTLTATNAGGSTTARVTVSVTAAQDTQPPTAPTLTAATPKSAAEADLSWMQSADNVGVAGYQVLRNGAQVGQTGAATSTYADTTVAAGATYIYAIRAFDAAGNVSPASNSMQVTIPSAPVASGNCPPPAAGAFTGCFYNNLTLSGDPSLVETDPQINFDWGGNSPSRAVGRGNFSARWQENFTFAQGTYTFTMLTSDGMRLYIDGVLVLDKWMDQAATQYTVQQSLSAGQHVIGVEYYEHSGWSTTHLSWQKN